MTKSIILTALVMVMALSTAVAQVQRVVLEDVTNAVGDSVIALGLPHTFSMRVTNTGTPNTYNVSNSFRIYSPEGATWDTVYGTWLNGFDGYFDQAYIDAFSQDGTGADTVGFGGFGFSAGVGLPPGYDDLAYGIHIGATPLEDFGKRICIDSSWSLVAGGTWEWSSFEAGDVVPDWSGPHCFVIGWPHSLTEPTEGATWFLGQSYAIRWEKPAGVMAVDIELSRNAGSSWETLSADETGSEFIWPATGDTTSQALIRILHSVDQVPIDTTDGVFSILEQAYSEPSSTSSMRGSETVSYMKGKGGRLTEQVRARAASTLALFALFDDGVVEAFFDDGAGFFDTSGTEVVWTDPGTTDMELADFNRDGNLDIAIVNPLETEITLHYGDGAGGFSGDPEDVIVMSAPPTALGAADFNFDGYPDLWVITEAPDQVVVFLSYDTGGHESVPAEIIPFDNAVGGVAAADIVGDLATDLAVAHGDDGTLTVYSGDGEGNFASVFEELVGGAPSDVTAADFDGDGFLDLGIIYGDASAIFTVFTNQGISFFDTSHHETIVDDHSECAVGDFTADGFADAVISSGSSDSLALLPGLPTGGFSQPVLIGVDGGPQDLMVNDFDGDGAPDLVVFNAGAQSIQMLPGVITSEIDVTMDIISPNGAEEWVMDSVYEISWVKGDGILSVNIQVSRDGGSSWETITTGIAGTSFQWTVNNPTSENALVKIFDPTVPSRSDVSDGVFTIKTCCIDTTGNVDYDVLDICDIGDLTTLIDFLFISYTPPVCMDEANVNGEAPVDIGDLTRLIDYLFISFEPLTECP
ncbi:MAG: VCBS repeat-containing protein [Candidatus Zixiibacteriota bacterium]|nr:MAG: VCBS repeat-containing protein [candidate division Zixibacteria bacterium]